MTPEQQRIFADLCEQMHDSLEQPDRLAWRDIRAMCSMILSDAKTHISSDLLKERAIEGEPNWMRQ